MCRMKPARKAARSRIKDIPTKAELALALERSTLTPDQREAPEGMERVWEFEHGRIIEDTAAVRNLLMMLNG